MKARHPLPLPPDMDCGFTAWTPSGVKREKFSKENVLTDLCTLCGSCHKKMLVADFPAMYKLTGQDEISKTYSFPKSYVSGRKPRAVSAGQRERARQMMMGQNRAIGRKDYPEN